MVCCLCGLFDTETKKNEEISYCVVLFDETKNFCIHNTELLAIWFTFNYGTFISTRTFGTKSRKLMNIMGIKVPVEPTGVTQSEMVHCVAPDHKFWSWWMNYRKYFRFPKNFVVDNCLNLTNAEWYQGIKYGCKQRKVCLFSYVSFLDWLQPSNAKWHVLCTF